MTTKATWKHPVLPVENPATLSSLPPSPHPNPTCQASHRQPHTHPAPRAARYASVAPGVAGEIKFGFALERSAVAIFAASGFSPLKRLGPSGC